MGDLSTHFNRSEFACQDNCGFNTVDAMLLAILEDVREYFGEVVTVTSGCRCESHNKEVGGGINSQHKLGRAADIQVANTLPCDVQAYLLFKHENLYGIGQYETFTHIDTRNDAARWEG